VRVDSEKTLSEIKLLIDNRFHINSILKKKKITAMKGCIMAVVKKDKKGYSIFTDLNFKNPKIILWTIIAILLPILGLIIVFTVIYLIFRNKRKKMSFIIENLILKN
jgi:hypothetical protein